MNSGDTKKAVDAILAELKKLGTKRNRDGMARYAIVAPKVFGVSVATLRAIGKRVGRSHDLALALWDTGWYEARMLAAFVDEPAKVTPAQMDRWCRDFDNWAICDTICFHLFDRTPHAWKKVAAWSTRKPEFEKRAGFALLASLAGHDKTSPDALFFDSLKLIERESTDERNFVKKAVNWALRRIGTRGPALRTAAGDLAARLAESKNATARWIGKDAMRDFAKGAARRQAKAASSSKDAAARWVGKGALKELIQVGSKK